MALTGEGNTPQGWSLKCIVLYRLEETIYESSSNMPGIGRKMRTILEEIKTTTLIYPTLTVPITPIALTAIEVAAGSKIDRPVERLRYPLSRPSFSRSSVNKTHLLLFSTSLSTY